MLFLIRRLAKNADVFSPPVHRSAMQAPDAARRYLSTLSVGEQRNTKLLFVTEGGGHGLGWLYDVEDVEVATLVVDVKLHGGRA